MKLLDLDRVFDNDRPFAGQGRLAPEPALSIHDLPGDWHAFWEERAAIMEFDGGLPRELAEHRALLEVLERMHGVT